MTDKLRTWTLCFATDLGERATRPFVFKRGEANNPCSDCVRVVEAEPMAELLERLDAALIDDGPEGPEVTGQLLREREVDELRAALRQLRGEE